MALRNIELDDRYNAAHGTVLLSGTQALVRMLMMQSASDTAAGLRTAGYVSGYRGSPLGGLDRELWRSRSLLERHDIKFHPAVNEDLAATAIWGTQQVGLFPGARYEGVFSLWYGKGPGVDRSGDAFKHANHAGTSPRGGVLVAFGDDHAAASSTLAHQSEYALVAAMIPTLNPASVADLLRLGLFGWALSRYAGLWVGLKCAGETVGTTASVDLDEQARHIVLPAELAQPHDGVHIRFGHAPLEAEHRLMERKLPLALAFARANSVDTVLMRSARRRIGIVTAGTACAEVSSALDRLGIDQGRAAELGIGLYRVALTWPLEPEGLRSFAAGFEELLIVEEKRPLIEDQAARLLYALPAHVRPNILGKTDEKGAPLLSASGTLSDLEVARVIAARLARHGALTADMQERLQLPKNTFSIAAAPAQLVRRPYFCSGCPHNRSTVVPQGSQAMAGIGCSYMALWMDRQTMASVHMGAEGANWIGIAPFSATPHIFQNLGDGTYFHSGLLAIRATVAAGVNITYKILYNDAVAMTGGQPVDGQLSVVRVARQLLAEGVKALAIVTDDTMKYRGQAVGRDVSVHPRTDLEAVQLRLRDTPGTTVLIYDQMCAAERRRQRKRREYPDPPKRMFINSAVCEGCGDCSAKSNCVSIVPLETPFGRKRRIHQSSCNKDYTCSEGFCPSFVTVRGGTLRKETLDQSTSAALVEIPPPQRAPRVPCNILITGIGGTGVVTLSAVLTMAAHLEGKQAQAFDLTGLAQKNGAVFSHVKIAEPGAALSAARIGAGRTDVVIGCDLVAAAAPDVLRTVARAGAWILLNARVTPTGDFQRDGDMDLQGEDLRRRIENAAGAGNVDYVDAASAAFALGEDAAANMFMLGFAFQAGHLPVAEAAIDRAIELNAVAVEQNKLAFRLGRLAGHDRSHFRAETQSRGTPPQTLDELIAFGSAHLCLYQDAAYAGRYVRFVAEVRAREQTAMPGHDAFSRAVAGSLLKLMAYKDEYEVARLYTSDDFRRELRREFAGPIRLTYHLAPPLLGSRDRATQQLRKLEFGPWVFWLFKALARCRRLRGTLFDPFGYTAERRMERGLPQLYCSSIRRLQNELDTDRYGLAVSIAAAPQQIRGFGHVKRASLERVNAEENRLWSLF